MPKQDEQWSDDTRELAQLTEPVELRDRLESIARLLAELPADMDLAGHRLLWRDATGVARCHILAEAATIGRDPACELVLEDEHLSRQHCRISRDACGEWQIEDLDSHNGTSVNGHLIDTSILHDGDVLLVGRTRLVFLK